MAVAVEIEAARLTSRAPRVSVVIPARNEARNIGWVLSRLPECVAEVILVDGRSTDGTVAAARATYPGIRVVPEPQPGKGAALRAGFEAATGEIVVSATRRAARREEGRDMVLSKDPSAPPRRT